MPWCKCLTPKEKHVHCTAVGAGPRNGPHAYLYDIDKSDPQTLDEIMGLIQECHLSPLVYKTRAGLHIINRLELDSLLRPYQDQKYTGSAIRVIPHQDYRLVSAPFSMCEHYLGIYRAIFPELKHRNILSEKCDVALHPGRYTSLKDYDVYV